MWEEQKSLQLSGLKKRYKNITTTFNITAFTVICVPVMYLQMRKFKGKGKMLGVLVLLLLCSFGWFPSSLSILSSWLCVRFFGNGCRMDFWLTVLSDGLSELWAFWNGRHECAIRKKYFVLKMFQNFASWKKLDWIFNRLLGGKLYFF